MKMPNIPWASKQNRQNPVIALPEALGLFGTGRKNAEIDAEVWIVETANKSSKVAVLSIEKAPGGAALGFDLDTRLRISEAYAISGKKLGKYLK